MQYLRYLEFQRLMKELQFVESDLDYRNEILRINDAEFVKSVNDFLEAYPDLKSIYEEKTRKSTQFILNDQEIKVEESTKEVDPELKRLYRNIAKTTHPDKISNNRLNELYNEATIAYDQCDIITLYKVSSELNIEFEIDDNFIDSVKIKIDNIKNSAKMIESTYTFKWINSNDEERNRIVFDFIKSKII